MKPLFFAIVLAALISAVAQAKPNLLVTHVQSIYAGGGGCAERFWFEWLDTSAEISNIEIHVKFKSQPEEPLLSMLKIDLLGVSVMDRSSEVLLETPRCLSGQPTVEILKATAILRGKPIDLIRDKQLGIGTLKRYQISIHGSRLTK